MPKSFDGLATGLRRRASAMATRSPLPARSAPAAMASRNASSPGLSRSEPTTTPSSPSRVVGRRRLGGGHELVERVKKRAGRLDRQEVSCPLDDDELTARDQV